MKPTTQIKLFTLVNWSANSGKPMLCIKATKNTVCVANLFLTGSFFNPHYRGPHYQLNLLTYLNDSLLTRLNIGETHEANNTDQVIQELQINPNDCDNALAKLQSELDNIKAMVGICLNS
jgi:hypothetical protein